MHSRPSFRQALNRAVAEKRLLVIPGAYDALSALLIERTGFDTMFVGGFPVAGARYGVSVIAELDTASRVYPICGAQYAELGQARVPCNPSFLRTERRTGMAAIGA